MKQPGAITHDKVIDILIEKGYLAHRYPMTATEFHPAILAALTAAPRIDARPVHQHEHQAQQFWREVRDVDGVRWFWVQRCACGDEIASLDTGPLAVRASGEPQKVENLK